MNLKVQLHSPARYASGLRCAHIPSPRRSSARCSTSSNLVSGIWCPAYCIPHHLAENPGSRNCKADSRSQRSTYGCMRIVLQHLVYGYPHDGSDCKTGPFNKNQPFWESSIAHVAPLAPIVLLPCDLALRHALSSLPRPRAQLRVPARWKISLGASTLRVLGDLNLSC